METLLYCAALGAAARYAGALALRPAIKIEAGRSIRPAANTFVGRQWTLGAVVLSAVLVYWIALAARWEFLQPGGYFATLGFGLGAILIAVPPVEWEGRSFSLSADERRQYNARALELNHYISVSTFGAGAFLGWSGIFQPTRSEIGWPLVIAGWIMFAGWSKYSRHLPLSGASDSTVLAASDSVLDRVVQALANGEHLSLGSEEKTRLRSAIVSIARQKSGPERESFLELATAAYLLHGGGGLEAAAGIRREVEASPAAQG